jgi:hypothetical protein
MFGLESQLREQAAESNEERAARLREAGGQAGVDPEVLLDVELMVEDAVAAGAAARSIEDAKARLAEKGIPVETVLGDIGADVVASLLAQGATKNPETTAEAVAAVNAALRESGLYDELDIDPASTTVPAEIDAGE